jgi:hypothetical protein
MIVTMHANVSVDEIALKGSSSQVVTNTNTNTTHKRADENESINDFLVEWRRTSSNTKHAPNIPKDEHGRYGTLFLSVVYLLILLGGKISPQCFTAIVYYLSLLFQSLC